jgi:pimeloyl-ACP methyl ester carboxylesterase
MSPAIEESGMRSLPPLAMWHAGIDRLAMWTEDRKARTPQRFAPGPRGELGCFGDLAELPAPPAGPGRWVAPSPRARHRGDLMRLHLFPAEGRSVGTAILVPPWKTEGVGLVRGWIRLLARAGRDVWLVVPPHHLERTAPGARSGEEFVSLDLAELRATFEQLVLELRVVTALAARRGPVDLVGLSLGGLASALAATAVPEVARVALIAPPADLAAVLGQTAIGARYRGLAQRAGTPLPAAGALREAFAAFDPALRPRPRADLFVAVGRYDAIALPEGAAALARAWGATASVYPRGHLTLLFACRALRRDLARFLAVPRPAALGAAAMAGVVGASPA